MSRLDITWAMIQLNLNYLLVFFSTIVAILLLIYRKYFKKKMPNWLFTVILIFLIGSLGTNVYIIWQEEEMKKYSRYSGEISGTEDIVYPSIKLGTAEFVWTGPEGEPMIVIGNDSIKVWIEDEELKISTVIRDEDGKIIAKLEANEWQVNPNLIFDRNFDTKAVEVINQKGEIVLQAEFDGESVLFAGVFYREDGWRVALGYNVIEIRPPGEPIQTTFPPMFKYPSELHPGERI